ncbi:MAG: helix-turn-helix domain-containing protein [Candidatus Omnitrophota bacterium]|nr:helix-turn-helix domain-containing protein [Candidatus Omnitrophota bacterium]
MGVVYKVTENLVAFIVDRKRSNPRLSCRGLVDIIHENFQVKVSKSSVNAVFQEFQLSSPVGRTPRGGKGGKKFQIPAERKKHLFGPGSPQKADAVIDIPATKGPGKSTASVHGHSPQKPPSALKTEKNSGIVVKSEGFSQVCDHAGCIFLKAAEWAVFDRPILAHIAQDAGWGTSIPEFEKICEILPYLQTFGINDVADIQGYGGQGLWALHGCKWPIPAEQFKEAITALGEPRSLALKLSCDLPYFYTSISSVRVQLKNLMEIYLDGEFISAWEQPMIPRPATLPVNKILSDVTARFLNAAYPCLIFSLPWQAAPMDAFSALVKAFDQEEGYDISSISLIDSANQEIAAFSMIPQKRRMFIAGIWPFHEDFDALSSLGNSGTMAPLTLTPWGRKVYYRDVSVEKKSKIHQVIAKKRLMVVFGQSAGEPLVFLLSNAPQAVSTRDIVTAFLQRWPELGDSSFVKDRSAISCLTNHIWQKEIEHGITSSISSIYESASVYEVFQRMMSSFVTVFVRTVFTDVYDRHGFDFSAYFSQRGSVRETENEFILKFNGAPDDHFRFAVKKINETGIHNYRNKKLILILPE